MGKKLTGWIKVNRIKVMKVMKDIEATIGDLEELAYIMCERHFGLVRELVREREKKEGEAVIKKTEIEERSWYSDGGMNYKIGLRTELR